MVFTLILSRPLLKKWVEVEYEFYPAKRAQLYAEIGKTDGSIAYFHNKNREKKFYFSDSIGKDNIMFFHLKSYKFDFKTKDDLKEINIGGTLGYNTLKKLEDLNASGNKFKIYVKNTDLDNLRLLVKGIVHVFPCSREVGLHLIRSNFSSKIVKKIIYHPKKFYSKSLYALFPKRSKRSKNLISILNEGLKRIHKNGKYNQLMDDFSKGKYKIN
ncbi:MAG: transporter substrate-binding domain-containing protein [Deltaproteobacteria bacterium]|nr:transporter substrate-binding domain-containing protein [Deltaproteobacteria bacterium]